jgi:hypothetical protein
VLGGHAALFPSSRILMLVYLVVYDDVAEVPGWFFVGLWAILQLWIAIDLAGFGAVSALAPVAGGFLWGLASVWLLRRPVRW